MRTHINNWVGPFFLVAFRTALVAIRSRWRISFLLCFVLRVCVHVQIRSLIYKVLASSVHVMVMSSRFLNWRAAFCRKLDAAGERRERCTVHSQRAWRVQVLSYRLNFPEKIAPKRTLAHISGRAVTREILFPVLTWKKKKRSTGGACPPDAILAISRE